MDMRYVLLIVIVLVLLSALPLAAFNEDDLFGDDFFFDDMIEDMEEAQDTHLDLLVSDEVEIGGLFKATVGGLFLWPDYSSYYFTAPISASGHLYLDARPRETFRVFTKAKVNLPPLPEDNPLSLYEYFADISWKDKLFIRAGKQVISWRAAPFWNPADILSAGAADIGEYEAEREGPLAFKASMPAGRHTFDLFLVDGGGSVKVVPRAVLYLPPAEVTAGIGYRYGSPVEGALSARVVLGDFNLFGEGLVYLSDLSSQHEGTLGFSWVDQERDLTAALQYYYGGEHESAVYIASRLFNDDLQGVLSWIHGWNGHDGMVSANITYNLLEGVDLSAGVMHVYGVFMDVSSGLPAVSGASIGMQISGRW